jgi:hypothetical protein
MLYGGQYIPSYFPVLFLLVGKIPGEQSVRYFYCIVQTFFL